MIGTEIRKESKPIRKQEGLEEMKNNERIYFSVHWSRPKALK
jgi:hypothetical protein